VALVAVPPGVVTEILPVVAPVGTVAVICVAEFTVKVVAFVVLNFTEVVVKPVPLKFVPLILTDVPTGPKAGVNEVIVGVAASAGAAKPNTRSAAPTNTPPKRSPIFRFELIRTLAFRGQAAA